MSKTIELALPLAGWKPNNYAIHHIFEVEIQEQEKPRQMIEEEARP